METISIVLGIMVFVVFSMLVYRGMQHFFSIHLFAWISNNLNSASESGATVNVLAKIDDEDNANNNNSSSSSNSSYDTSSNEVPEIKFKKQVFNVPNNTYTYSDARAVCQAYGARLATYDEIESAYNEGAEWCNYGWSSNQMAYFPTQKKTFQELQKIKGHENDCGRPGVNGGKIANPNVKFGANCFGYKPEITTQEEQMMAANKDQPYPESTEDKAMQERVAYYKSILPTILVSPFNNNLWSKLL